MIGVLGGLGSAATVDFLAKVVECTPATCDQDHLPMTVLFVPQTPDRSAHVMHAGQDPWPMLRWGIQSLLAQHVGVIAVVCNNAHHWHAAMSQLSPVPILHIAQACVKRIVAEPGARVALFGTRGTLQSGFYQAHLTRAHWRIALPTPSMQTDIDACITQVKAGQIEHARLTMQGLLDRVPALGANVVILGCTELPLAARGCHVQGLTWVDSNRCLAQEVVSHALAHGWSRRPGPLRP